MQQLRKPSFAPILSCLSLILMVTLTGCPYSSVFKLDNEPRQAIDDRFIGNWATIAGGPEENSRRPVRVIIEPLNDKEVNIQFIGYLHELNKLRIAENDTIRGTAFTSTVSDRQFLNIRIKGLYYIAEVMYDHDRLSLLPVNEHFTNKIIKTDDELRKSIMWHFKTRLYPYYDETFCLRQMIRVN